MYQKTNNVTKGKSHHESIAMNVNIFRLHLMVCVDIIIQTLIWDKILARLIDWLDSVLGRIGNNSAIYRRLLARNRQRILNIFLFVLSHWPIELNFNYIQQCWYCCGTSDVRSRGHPSSCVSTPSSVHSQDGGSTVMISHCASVLGFQLLVFLFIQIQQDDCSAAWPILCAVVLLHHPVTPNAENNHQTDCAGDLK